MQIKSYMHTHILSHAYTRRRKNYNKLHKPQTIAYVVIVVLLLLTTPAHLRRNPPTPPPPPQLFIAVITSVVGLFVVI